ncbi:MAG: succinate dehydrogenase cytochrome b subunit [Acidobacteria bacterium]|nr:succinate dehydrogenase cytochrome b subunit [Acidobacteriota bacterium]
MTALSSTIWTKVLIALSGLALVLYLVLHLAGNVLIFAGAETFNKYSHTLISNPLVIPAELALLAVFLLHVYKTVVMWATNQRARPTAYHTRRWAGPPSRKSWASSTMILTGIVTLLFVIVHVATFKFGTYYAVEGQDIRDLYRLEIETFRRPGWVAVYVAGMTLIGFHLWHGFSSAFESLGARHPRYTPRILALGRVLAVAVAGGFMAIPLWIYFRGW